jgi:hypothetical protein
MRREMAQRIGQHGHPKTSIDALDILNRARALDFTERHIPDLPVFDYWFSGECPRCGHDKSVVITFHGREPETRQIEPKRDKQKFSLIAGVGERDVLLPSIICGRCGEARQIRPSYA